MQILNRLKEKKGYTLAELLTVIGITVILCSIAIVSIKNYYSNLKQIEMDNTAKQIYIAAQNHLSYAESSGQFAECLEEEISGNNLLKKPSDMKKSEWEKNKEEYRYIVYNPEGDSKNNLKETVLRVMLPSGAIDDTVRMRGSYIIEYNKRTAAIYGVFYAEKGYENVLTEKDELEKFLSGNEYRGTIDKNGKVSKEEEKKAKKNRRSYKNESGKFNLGYYGGSGVNLPKGKVKKPTVEIKNEDKLMVLITDENGNNSSTGISLRVKGADSGEEKAFHLGDPKKALNWSKDEKKFKSTNNKTVYSVTLDDVTTAGCHFAELFGDDFIPGEDLYVIAESYGTDSITSLAINKPQRVNSLYNSVSKEKNGKTANVSCIRHIENLDDSISGIETKKSKDTKKKDLINAVKQNDDIDYANFERSAKNKNGKPVNSFYIYKNGEKKKTVAKNSYYSIKNDNIKRFEGNGHSIKNLEIVGQNNAGLFSEVTGSGLRFSNLTLKDPKVQGISSAGGFVGTAKNKQNGGIDNNVAIYNSCVEGKDSIVEAVGRANSIAGGLIGDCQSACDVKDSFSTAIVKSNNIAGGLIGTIKNPSSDYTYGCVILNSYVGGRTYGAGKYNPYYCNITAPEYSGGFIGCMEGNRFTWIDNCYTTASVKGNGRVGGFIGRSDTFLSVKNSYATGLIKDTNLSAGSRGTFIGESNKYNASPSVEIFKWLLEILGIKNFDLNELSWGNNYVLYGVNGRDFDVTGTNKENGIYLARKAGTTDIRKGLGYSNAHPYDEGLIKGLETGDTKFKLRTVTGDTHYGDWPDYNTVVTITKTIKNKTSMDDNPLVIDRDLLGKQNLYFTLINETKNIKQDFKYKNAEFQRNNDGTYTYAFVLSGDDFGPNDVLSFHETNEKVDKVFGEKKFTVKKEKEYSLEGRQNEEDETISKKDSVKFNLGFNDLVKIDVENTYLDRAYLNFQYKDSSTKDIKSVQRKEAGAGYGVNPPTGAKVKPSKGTMFRGLWVLTDEFGNPIDKDGNKLKNKSDWIVINDKGEIVTNIDKGSGTEKYKIPNKPKNVKRGEYNIYFTALYEKFPVITIQYGVEQNGDFSTIIADDYSQVKIGDSFNKKINIQDVLSDKYNIKKFNVKPDLRHEDSIKVDKRDNTVSIDIKEVYGDYTIQLVVSGDESLYGIEYVLHDSVYDEKTGNIDFAEGKTARVKPDDFISGIKGTLTSLSKEKLHETPTGFKEPKWNETIIGGTHKEVRRYLDPEYEGDDTSEEDKEKWIEEEIDVPDVFVSVEYEREIDRLRYSLNGGYLDGKSVIPTKSYKAGQKVKLSEKPEKNGYKFMGWELTDDKGKNIFISGKSQEIDYVDDTGKAHEITVVPEKTEFVIEEKTVNAKAVWQRCEKAKYTVEFYVQNISDEFYFVDDNAIVDDKTPKKTYMYMDSISVDGNTGDTLDNGRKFAEKYKKHIASLLDLEENGLEYNSDNTHSRGFTRDGKQLTVKADGSTVVKVFYDRKLYTLQFKTDETGWEYSKVPFEDNELSPKQYGLISGADLCRDEDHGDCPDVYYPLERHVKTVKNWRMDNYIPVNDSNGVQYGIYETGYGKRYKKLEKRTKKNVHWKLRYKYVETKNKSGKRFAVFPEPFVPNGGSYDIGDKNAKTDYILMENYKNSYWWFRYWHPVKTGHGAGLYKFATYEDGELRPATWNRRGQYKREYIYDVNGQTKTISEEDGYRRLYSSWKGREWEKYDINGKIYRQHSLKNTELSKEEAEGRIFKREEDTNGLINGGVPLYKEIKTDKDGNLYYMHTEVETKFTYHLISKHVKSRDYKVITPDKKVLIDENNANEIYYYDGNGYVPVDLEITTINKWFIDGKEYTGQRYKINGDSDYYGTVYDLKGTINKRFEEAEKPYNNRNYYGKDGNDVYCELKPHEETKYYWTCDYTENGKPKHIVYSQQRYRRTGKKIDVRTIYAISGIYGHNISEHFPVRDNYIRNYLQDFLRRRYGITQPLRNNIGTRWEPMHDTDAYGKEVMAFIPFMPKEDISFKPNFGIVLSQNYNGWYISKYYPYVNLNYYVETIDNAYNPGARFFVEPYASINARYGILYKDLDWYNLYGFKKYDTNPHFDPSGKKGGSINTEYLNKPMFFYYERNMNDLEFKNSSSKNISVAYEDEISKNLPNVNYVNRNKSAFIPGDDKKLVYPLDDDYVFEGWYSSQTFNKGDKIEKNSHYMPNGKFKVFANWVAPYKTVTIHYKEDPAKSEWKEKKIKVQKYDVASVGSDHCNKKLAEALSECSNKNKNKDYEFCEWFYDDEMTQLYDYGDGVTDDINLYAEYTQLHGKKSIKVRYVFYDEEHNPIYFLVNEDGKVQYEDDGKTVRTTKDKKAPNSWYTVTGELNSKGSIAPDVIYNYKPKFGNVLVCFNSETKEVEIEFEPVETWSYTVNCYLNGEKKVLLEKDVNYTYYSQIIEQAPKFDGFKLVSDDEFAVFNPSSVSYDFYYEIDKDYDYVVAGDYDFSSKNFGVAYYEEGKAHEITLEEILMHSVPEALKTSVSYEKILEKEYDLKVEDGSGNGKYKLYDNVSVAAKKAEKGTEFDHWEVTEGNVKINNPYSERISFEMPLGNVGLKAIYKDLHKVAVKGGKANVTNCKEGTKVKLKADGNKFDHWKMEEDIHVENLNKPEMSFIMPDRDVNIEAVYRKSDDENEPEKERYTVTVIGGLTDSNVEFYEMGSEVSISSNKPESGKEFVGWEVVLGNITVSNLSSKDITFNMPDDNVIIKATYKYKEVNINEEDRQKPEMIRVPIDGPPVDKGSYVARIRAFVEEKEIWESEDINLEIKEKTDNPYKPVEPVAAAKLSDVLTSEKFSSMRNPKIQVNVIPEGLKASDDDDKDPDE